MIKYIDSYKVKLLETKIRDKETSTDELRLALYNLGKIMGDEVYGSCRLKNKEITTPLLKKFWGSQIKEDEGATIVISTKDDYDYFAKGISEGCSNVYRGYMDFDGVRGVNTYTSPARSIEFPKINSEIKVTRMIIAKSVIASGCTAITLAKKALTQYFASELIIAAPFYSKKGIDELLSELNMAKIYVASKPDEIDENGMLVPGVGNIDKRLAG